jgi:glycosyltransferase involved in cell wall biosynthesis
MSSTPALSIVVPFSNEGEMVESTVSALARDDAEFIFVDDGSSDQTGQRLLEAARHAPNIRVIAHERNKGANAALLTGLYAATGESIIVLDADLSYGPEHVDVLVSALRSQYAAIAVASPYHLEGTVYNVPPTRLALSVVANRFFRSITRSHVATYTGMVRAYSRSFLSRVDPRTLTGEINCALILAALSRGERVVEVPARLAWPDVRRAEARLSARSLARRTGSVLASLRHVPLPKVPFSPTPMLPMSSSTPGYATNKARHKDWNG